MFDGLSIFVVVIDGLHAVNDFDVRKKIHSMGDEVEVVMMMVMRCYAVFFLLADNCISLECRTQVFFFFFNFHIN